MELRFTISGVVGTFFAMKLNLIACPPGVVHSAWYLCPVLFRSGVLLTLFGDSPLAARLGVGSTTAFLVLDERDLCKR